MKLHEYNVFDDLVDPEDNGSFVSYHLEGKSLVAVHHEDHDKRYLIEVRIHPLDDEDWNEGPILINTRGGFAKMVINGKPNDRKTLKDELTARLKDIKTPKYRKAYVEWFKLRQEYRRNGR